MKKWGGNADLVLFFVLAAAAFWFVDTHPLGLKEDASAALAGALVGGAALLLGNWINRRDETQRAESAEEQQRAKLKALIGAELVNVAAGLIGAKQLVDAAYVSTQAGGVVGDHVDMTMHMPRGMPFMDSLGAELLILDQPAIDALVTLRADLAVTRITMGEVTQGRMLFGTLTATSLGRGLAHNMTVLADAFQHIAPTRQLALNDKVPEVASALLRRLAG